MITRYKIIISSIFITAIILFIYASLRSEAYEGDYIQSMQENSTRIEASLQGYQQGTALKDKNLNYFLSSVIKKYENIALIAVALQDNSILAINKNNRYFESNELYDSIIRDFKEKGIKTDSKRSFVIRYFNQTRFYIFIKTMFDAKILVIYPYQLYVPLKTQFILEMVLMAILSIIIHSLIYLYLQQRGGMSDDVSYNVVPVGGDAATVLPKKNNVVRNIKDIASNSLNTYVAELFDSISKRYGPESISLYVIEQENKLGKRFELKGKTFFTINTSDYEIISLDNDLGYELKKSSAVILENNKKIVFPLTYRNIVIGVMIILRENGFNGNEIGDIKSHGGEIANFLNEYLMLNDIVLEKDAGIYSTTYFRLKYNELHNLFLNTNRHFGVILLSPFQDDIIEAYGEENTVIKNISGKINEQLNPDNILCKTGRNFSIIVPDTDKNDIFQISRKLLESLRDMKIRLRKNTYCTLHPYIGYATTVNLQNGDDPLEIAERNLKYAQSKNDSNVQSVRVADV